MGQEKQQTKKELEEIQKLEKRRSVERQVDWPEVIEMATEIGRLIKQGDTKFVAQKSVIQSYGYGKEYSLYSSAIAYRLNDLKKLKGMPDAILPQQTIVRNEKKKATITWWDDMQSEPTPEVESVIMNFIDRGYLVNELERGVDVEQLRELGYEI